MNTTRLAFLVAGVLMAAVGGVISALASMRMVEKINRRHPPASRESPYGWSADKTWRVIAEYRRLAPSGPLWPRFAIASSIAVVGVVLCALSLGFFS